MQQTSRYRTPNAPGVLRVVMPNTAIETIWPWADLSTEAHRNAAPGGAEAALDRAYDRIEAGGTRPIWISVRTRAEAKSLLAAARERLEAGAALPLFGIPFAVKDNIDVAGLPTTAACPDFAYEPECSAYVVERLVAAGAIPVGKTNLDQFATGLNGTRTPYGIPSSALDASRISGGSSSGSAVAVAAGLVPFALGTDTAGSGRVPAAFNNLVGLKPSRGLLSNRGVVPACRSLDCVSVFAATVGDASIVAKIASGFDPHDPFSRPPERDPFAPCSLPQPLRFGTASAADLAACEPGIRTALDRAATALEQFGGQRVEIDFGPFREAATLLYSGPWVAERLAGLGTFAREHPHALHPTLRSVLREAERFTAADAFEGDYRLEALMRAADREWARMDVLLLPTAPQMPTIEAMLACPEELNAQLGLYTNFVNLMDLAALAVPAGFTDEHLPTGVTLVGPRWSDGMLAAVGDALHRAIPGATLGASSVPLPPAGQIAMAQPVAEAANGKVRLAVVGAHLRGEPLNGQLTDRGAAFVGTAHTARGYSLYVLSGTTPPKPGLIRDGGEGGIELEIWELADAGFGSFVAAIPPPHAVGTLALADGTAVKGFLCEQYALAGAQDITRFRGWRAYRAALSAAA